MSCYCTQSWDNPNSISYYSDYPYTNGAQVTRAHCTPSISGVSLCVESAEGSFGGTISLRYKGKSIVEADFIWGEPIVLAGSYWGFGIGLSAMPHRNGCIEDIEAGVCYKTHCSQIKIPSFCLFGS